MKISGYSGLKNYSRIKGWAEGVMQREYQISEVVYIIKDANIVSINGINQ